MNAENLLKGLNEVQRLAVMHKNGPAVVFSGAGSGKTKIITSRIAYLIESGVPPHEILAVTFTNKAAAEMRGRVEALLPRGRFALISTFHSACARWLREFADQLGFTADFTIYDDADSTAALKVVAKDLNIEVDVSSLIVDWRRFIDKAKMNALLPVDVERLQSQMSHLIPVGGLIIYRKYQEYLAACNAMDFGDLILNVLLLLRRNDQVREIMQARYRYILVDEYQDTNRTQLELITALAAKYQNLFVVGDDDQSIYSWRGATPGNILDFDVVFPTAKKITLEQNYRCTGNIVGAANAMVINNKKRAEKRLWTDNPPGDLISFRLDYDGESEARWVVDTIRRESRSRYPLSDTAIFYRTNSQSRLLEEALRAENIPYTIYGGVRFYDRMEIKDVLAYMRLTVNESDDVSFRRVVNVPSRKIGPKALETVEHRAAIAGLPLMQIVRQMIEENDPALNDKIRGFYEIIQRLRQSQLEVSLSSMLERFLQITDYVGYLQKKFPSDEAMDKIENIHELGAAMADFERRQEDATLALWLQSVSLTSETEDATGGVAMMTLHSAKGLEFPRVHIVGLEEGLLPHGSNLEDEDLLEEERRLFYVGMTRAKVKLSLSCAYRRRMYDRYVSNRPSRFLKEIPTHYLDTDASQWSTIASASSTSDRSNQINRSSGSFSRYGAAADNSSGKEGLRSSNESRPPAPAKSVSVGAAVFHPTYGKGIVEAIEQEFAEVKVIVNFSDHGRRKVNSHHLLFRPADQGSARI